jgi:hypothetical protein
MFNRPLLKSLRERLLPAPAAALLIASIALAPVARAADAPPIDPAAAASLEAMGKTLAASQFSFRIRTIREYADSDGQPLSIFHEGTVVVRRPDRLRVDMSGDDGQVRIADNGKEFTLIGMDMRKFATIPAGADLRDTLRTAEERLAFDFPLADFLVQDSRAAFLTGVVSGRKVGEVTIGEARADHLLFLQPPGIELQLWVQKGERAVPRRLVVTYRSLPGEPRFIAEMNDWNFDVRPSDADFTLQIPQGFEKVEPAQEARP